MANGRGRPKKATESPEIMDSPIAEQYQEAAETGIFDPLAIAKAEKAEKTGKVKEPEIVSEEVASKEDEPEEERDIFDAIESGEIIPIREPAACEDCRFKFGKPVCSSCIEYRNFKKLKESK